MSPRLGEKFTYELSWEEQMGAKSVADPSRQELADRGVYRDGTAAERCATCHQMLRDASGATRVPVLVSDLEEIACLLVDYVNDVETWGDTIQRLEQAVGRTVKQIKAAERVVHLREQLAEAEADADGK